MTATRIGNSWFVVLEDVDEAANAQYVGVHINF